MHQNREAAAAVIKTINNKKNAELSNSMHPHEIEDKL